MFCDRNMSPSKNSGELNDENISQTTMFANQEESKEDVKIKEEVCSDVEEICEEIFICNYCYYETTSADCFRWHECSHIKNTVPGEGQSSETIPDKDLSGEPIPLKFCCPQCTYKSKWKGNVKTHLLIHKSPLDVKMFECFFCPYQTKLKGNLKNHSQRRHKFLNMEMFPSCGFSLESNARISEELQDLQSYECSKCEYQTNWKSNLKIHSLIHYEPQCSELFRCFICPYQTKLRENLKSHLIKHRAALR
ncbi:unnamed protein product [Acanthoscelides obtectus]|uniref:C2H2-type domain-containing protein n=1 Tax=Acanthoscelides obtectus TaxID=200917 RepID=A0A9P0NWS6_ACAOB|nr:unnamed protein product [Acanthoscelides obtectus]CAK1634737.1 Zinc finger protein 142 [Acanthoscelides obtectus]